MVAASIVVGSAAAVHVFDVVGQVDDVVVHVVDVVGHVEDAVVLVVDVVCAVVLSVGAVARFVVDVGVVVVFSEIQFQVGAWLVVLPR